MNYILEPENAIASQHDYNHTSIITVVAFRDDKLQGVDICSLINYTLIIFSLELIWIDWSTQKVANFWFSKSFFYVKNQPNSSDFFFIEEYNIRRRTFINDTFRLFS